MRPRSPRILCVGGGRAISPSGGFTARRAHVEFATTLRVTATAPLPAHQLRDTFPSVIPPATPPLSVGVE
jgi:hypothetical protein